MGVALLAGPPPRKPRGERSNGEKSEKGGKSRRKHREGGGEAAGAGAAAAPTPASSAPLTPEQSRAALQAAQAENLRAMMAALEDDGGGDGRHAPMVKLGDASMAAPFTARGSGVAPCLHILRQGRCTLVTTLQMFKILGLNCLANAYVLSVQYLDGVKLGDTQAVISGLLTAALFMCLSRAQPLELLSPRRPHPSIFCGYVFLSVMGQFAVHITFLVFAVHAAEALMPAASTRLTPDATFSANSVNTVSYLVNLSIQTATFAVNYMGHPVNQPLTSNTALFRTLFVCGGAFIGLTLELVPQLNASLELVRGGGRVIPPVSRPLLCAACPLTCCRACVSTEVGVHAQPVLTRPALLCSPSPPFLASPRAPQVHLPLAFRASIVAAALADLAICFVIEHGLRRALPPPQSQGIREGKRAVHGHDH